MLAALTQFAQNYSYYTYPSTGASSGMSEGYATFMSFVIFGVLVVTIISMWRLFKKAGQPGWPAIIPVYNVLILLKIVGRPWWWVLLMLLGVIPVVGWVAAAIVSVIIYHDLSKSFGKGVGTTILLVLVPIIGFPLLAFGDATYHGPAALNGPGGAGTPASPGTPPASAA